MSLIKLGFYGAAGEVTGSNFLIETAKHRIIVDCGMFQGARLAEKRNTDQLAYDPRTVDVVVLTHAHLDHCGRIPLLRKLGFKGKIYATPATRDLAELIMADAANIMLHDLEDEGEQPLYLAVDVARSLPLFEPVDYRTRTEILPGVWLEFYDAGHILGSASARLEIEGKSLVFSGDIGNHPVPMLRRPEVPETADVVVMETTYGGRIHEGAQDRRVKLRSVIRQAAEKQGVLLIPAFALERTQELLYELHGLVEEQSIPPLPVFLDSPLAIAATDVYYRYPQYFDQDATTLLEHGADLFKFPLLKITASAEQSKMIKEVKGPKIIIAGSGMMEGGRIVHHAKEFLDESSTTLLMVGYQGQGTLGRKLFDGQRRVKIKGSMVSVQAHVVAIGAYSAHADQTALIEWLGQYKTKPSQVYLVHGEDDQATAFANKISGGYQVSIPQLNQVVEI